MPTLVGSRALANVFDDFYRPVAKADVDYISAIPWAEGIILPNWIELFVDERLGGWGWGEVATRDELYTLKISHIFWEVGDSWNKHAADIAWMERQGCQLIRPLYDILYPIWKEKHGGRKAVLANASKDGFFKDGVTRKYDHDSLHDSVAYYNRPLYERLLKPGSEVDCSWDQFCELDHNDRIKLVREEVYVTALERILVPQGYKGSPGRAYHWALRRTITSLFKNEWALFVAMNLSELARADIDYLRLHKQNRNKLILLEDK